MPLVIPTITLPSQTLQAQVNGQGCNINVYQSAYGLFLDLYAAGALIVGGVLCKNRTLIVRNAYLGFVGDIAFIDQQGSNDPNYTGLGSRYLLFYLFPSDLGPGQA
jgi:hypothetical protein